MREAVRMIIWDLDETFWRGTLSEGEVVISRENHELVVQLARRGIISSICSKNDLAGAQSLLEEEGIWSYFVFPSINWEVKGPRIAALLEASMLRPSTVMFIDDNPMNLSEATYYVPGIQTADPRILQGLLDNPLFAGKEDPGLSRLAQYKLLEKRNADRQAAAADGGANFDFLRSSHIEVRLEFDVERHIDRAVELINRTNQLNFTKKRLSEDPEHARTELRTLVQGYDVQAGLVHVCDRYGDYGFVGFYAARTVQGRSDLVHFCFSCRVLGMGVETWVYRNIGRPWLPMVGEVRSDPRDDSLPVDWISQERDGGRGRETGGGAPGCRFEKVVIRGGCAGLSIAHYFHSVARTVVSEVATARNGVPIRLEHSLFTARALDQREDGFEREVAAIGYQRSDFATRMFERGEANAAVILDFWTDAEVAIYRHRRLGFRIPFLAPYHFPVAPETNVMDLPAGFTAEGFGADHPFFAALGRVRSEYEYEGLIGEDLFKANLRRIFSSIPGGAEVFVLSAKERWLNRSNGLTYVYPSHVSINQWAAEIAGDFRNVKVLDIQRFLRSESDAETVNHFDRLVYHRIYSEVAGALSRAGAVELGGTAG